MFGRLGCWLGLHRVITTRAKPKAGYGGLAPYSIVYGACYRNHCKFTFSKRFEFADGHAD